MNTDQKLRCLFFMLIAACAFVATIVQIAPYFALGFVGANVQFWQDTLTNAASRFITVDVMFVFLVGWWWMLTEARRLNMRGYGWYLPVSVLVSFSVALPLFMLHRELALHRAGLGETVGDTGRMGIVSLVLIAAAALAYSCLAFGMRQSM